MKKFNFLRIFTALILISVAVFSNAQTGSDLKFEVSFQKSQYSKPQDGRLLLLLSDNNEQEPRFQILASPETQLAFGIDVEDLKPGESVQFDKTVFGYPIKCLSGVPAGEYWVQGLFHIYETFNRGDGHIVKLPMDRGEGQQWNRAPGNLYSIPQKIKIHTNKKEIFNIEEY